MSKQGTSRDPAIEEVREVRRTISRRFGHDPTRIVEYYLRLQERYRERFVKERPRREEDQDEQEAV